ncbi:MAG: HNH endonuclease [Bacteroidaceae bacterium]|nr:HNH endonuclease [Bacteroidaceae bacterium]
MSKDKDYNQMIQSVRWKRLRREKLMQSAWCERCRRNDGRLVAATCVHHITPVETAATRTEKERLMFSIGNLQSLCNSCHAEVHKELQSRNRKEMQRRRIENEVRRMEKYFK